MAPQATTERVSADELEQGDRVLVHVNGRAAEHLGVTQFEATVGAVSFGDVRLDPDETLQKEQDTHTWYSDIGYIHGFHKDVGSYTDIGRVKYVERLA